jgi:hypothetical protein
MAVRLSALRAGRSLPPGRFLVLISVRGWVNLRATVSLEGLSQLNNPMTSSGMEPATFRFVAQYLNQLRYCVLRVTLGTAHNSIPSCAEFVVRVNICGILSSRINISVWMYLYIKWEYRARSKSYITGYRIEIRSSVFEDAGTPISLTR